MTLKELALLVKKMREAQHRYFRDRTPEALERAKYLEHDVDAAVREALDPRPGLFDPRD